MNGTVEQSKPHLRGYSVLRPSRPRHRWLPGVVALAALLWSAAPAQAQCCFCGGCPTGEFCTETPVDQVACSNLCDDACTSVIFDHLDSCAGGCGPLDVAKKEKCRLTKLKAAGKYAYCRFKEDRKAALSGNPADYSRCDDRLQSAFAQAEQTASFNCYSVNDVASVQAFIATMSDEVDDSLAGGGAPTCP